MKKVHLYESDCGMNGCAYRCQCGFIAGSWETERLEMIDHRNVNCKNCMLSARYKELKQLDETMSEIKTEEELEFDDKPNLMLDREDGRTNSNQVLNTHYNQSSTPTIEKINEVLEHLEGKINNKQAAQIYNFLKYWDRCEHKEDKSKDLFKCADSIHNAITGEFINEKGK